MRYQRLWNNKALPVIRAVVAALTIVGTLSGCGGSGVEATKDGNGATVIKFGINVANPAKQEPATNAIVEAFNKANAGKYKVEFVAADTESHAKNMKLAASDGTLPQIFWVEGSEVTDFNEAGVLLDLKDFLNQNADVQKALNGAEKAFQNDEGVQYGLPYQSNVQGIFYNKEVFDNAGVSYPTDDTTYDEFLDMVAKLKASGVTPLSIGSKNSSFAMWEFNIWLSRFGWNDNIDAIIGGHVRQWPMGLRRVRQEYRRCDRLLVGSSIHGFFL